MSINVYIIKKNVIVQNEENQADEKRGQKSENLRRTIEAGGMMRDSGGTNSPSSEGPAEKKTKNRIRRKMSAAQENRMQASKGGGARE